MLQIGGSKRCFTSTERCIIHLMHKYRARKDVLKEILDGASKNKKRICPLYPIKNDTECLDTASGSANKQGDGENCPHLISLVCIL